MTPYEELAKVARQQSEEGARLREQFLSFMFALTSQMTEWAGVPKEAFQWAPLDREPGTVGDWSQANAFREGWFHFQFRLGLPGLTEPLSTWMRVKLELRLLADGTWRIKRFPGDQPFAVTGSSRQDLAPFYTHLFTALRAHFALPKLPPDDGDRREVGFRDPAKELPDVEPAEPRDQVWGL